jgi:hypothetical protein
VTSGLQIPRQGLPHVLAGLRWSLVAPFSGPGLAAVHHRLPSLRSTNVPERLRAGPRFAACGSSDMRLTARPALAMRHRSRHGARGGCCNGCTGRSRADVAGGVRGAAQAIPRAERDLRPRQADGMTHAQYRALPSAAPGSTSATDCRSSSPRTRSHGCTARVGPGPSELAPPTNSTRGFAWGAFGIGATVMFGLALLAGCFFVRRPLLATLRGLAPRYRTT